jgi:uncharacterized protein (DUF2267 family)
MLEIKFSMNLTTHSHISDEQAMQFFHGLKKELAFTSTQKIFFLVQMVLSKLSAHYTAQQLNEIALKTPSSFHSLFQKKYRAMTAGKEPRHLDEIVVALMEEEQEGKKVFKSEVETLGFVITILSSVEKLLKTIGIKIFNYSLSNELQQALSTSH